MAQEIVTRVWCDRHLSKEGDHVEARTVGPITIGKDRDRLLDLCAECEADVYAPLAELLLAEGRSADTGRRRHRSKTSSSPRPTTPDADGTYPCPEPDCDRVFDHKNALGPHVFYTHRKPKTDERLPFGCAASGCDRSFTTQQGASMHYARTHSKANE